MTEKTLIVATAILCAFGWSCCNSTQDQAEKLNAEAAKEYLTPIRPASLCPDFRYKTLGRSCRL